MFQFCSADRINTAMIINLTTEKCALHHWYIYIMLGDESFVQWTCLLSFWVFHNKSENTREWVMTHVERMGQKRTRISISHLLGLTFQWVFFLFDITAYGHFLLY
jgi:hypothetical protein